MHRIVFLICIVTASLTLSVDALRSLGGRISIFCAVQYDGQNYCIGSNSKGGLGLGSATPVDSSLPVKMLNVVNASHVAAGNENVCIVDQGGVVKCVGWNQNGMLGNGDTIDSNILQPAQVSEVAVKLYTNLGERCALLASGGLRCWGQNQYGSLGTSSPPVHPTLIPAPVIGFENFGVMDVAIGGYHICLITTIGAVMCSGISDNLGDGSTVNRHTMGPVPSLSEGIVSIGAGAYHTCAAHVSGTAYCWGQGASGKLGRGTSNANSLVPIIPTTFSQGIVEVFCGNENTFGILAANRSVIAFGKNEYGQLGAGHTTSSGNAVSFGGGIKHVQEIRGSYYSTCVSLSTGEVKCVGRNVNGVLGRGAPASNTNYLTLENVVGWPMTPSPTLNPTFAPSASPTWSPSATPTVSPSATPTVSPSATPTLKVTAMPANVTKEEEEDEQNSEDLSLVGLVALAPILAIFAGAAGYCCKPPEVSLGGGSGALQSPSNPV